MTVQFLGMHNSSSTHGQRDGYTLEQEHDALDDSLIELLSLYMIEIEVLDRQEAAGVQGIDFGQQRELLFHTYEQEVQQQTEIFYQRHKGLFDQSPQQVEDHVIAEMQNIPVFRPIPYVVTDYYAADLESLFGINSLNKNEFLF